MKKTTVALVIAALMAVAANPAFACGRSGGYRAAQSVKNPAAAKTTTPKNDPAPTTTTSTPGFMPGSAHLSGVASQA
jgi:hypothetical protein